MNYYIVCSNANTAYIIKAHSEREAEKIATRETQRKYDITDTTFTAYTLATYFDDINILEIL